MIRVSGFLITSTMVLYTNVGLELRDNDNCNHIMIVIKTINQSKIQYVMIII